MYQQTRFRRIQFGLALRKVTTLVGLLGLSNCAEPTPAPKQPPHQPQENVAGARPRLAPPPPVEVGELIKFVEKTTPWGCVKNKPSKTGLQYSACMIDANECRGKNLPGILDSYMRAEDVVLEWTGCEDVQNPWCGMRLLVIQCGEVVGTEIGRKLCPTLTNSSHEEFKPPFSLNYPIAICSLYQEECSKALERYEPSHAGITVTQYKECMPFDKIRQEVLISKPSK